MPFIGKLSLEGPACSPSPQVPCRFEQGCPRTGILELQVSLAIKICSLSMTDIPILRAGKAEEIRGQFLIPPHQQLASLIIHAQRLILMQLCAKCEHEARSFRTTSKTNVMEAGMAIAACKLRANLGLKQWGTSLLKYRRELIG